jgi:WD40 repeat protein
MNKYSLIVLLSLFLHACNSSFSPMETTATATMSSISSKPNMLLTETHFVPTLPTAVNGFLKLSDLESGIYVVYYMNSQDKNYLDIASFSGIYKGRLAELRGLYGTAISPDKNYLADLPYIQDLSTGVATHFDELENCTHPVWSPDSKQFAISCPTDKFQHDDVYIFSIENYKKVPITNCEHDALSCSPLSWSSDGRWIAYFRGMGGAGVSQLEGLHIIDNSCFKDITLCWHDEPGIKASPYAAWSPNGQLLASADDNKVNILKVNDGNLTLLESYQSGDSVVWLEWINNNEILFFNYNGGYIITREVGSIMPLESKQESIFYPKRYDSAVITIP